MRPSCFVWLLGELCAGWSPREIDEGATLDREQTIRSLEIVRGILERVRQDAPEDLAATTDGAFTLGDVTKRLIELIEIAESDHKAAQGRLL